MIRSFSSAVKKTVYVTTPIYYVNACKFVFLLLRYECINLQIVDFFLSSFVAPHIGHLYSSLIADAVQRWQVLSKPETSVRFATGTDEHGTKIQQAAAKNDKSLPEYCLLISDKYKKLSNVFSVGYTDFIRTTDENHKSAVKAFWVRVYERFKRLFSNLMQIFLFRKR